MKIAILGTGNVGQTFAEKLVSLGHQVLIGTRNPQDTLTRTDAEGKALFAEWHAKNSTVSLHTFNEAVANAEIIINALKGMGTIDALKSCDNANFNNKIVIDIANPLDFSKGFPPFLDPSMQNTNSLGEEVQKLLPNAKVVKTLNTMWCGIMVNPKMIGGGDHVNFICGNDKDAKQEVINFIKTFGWNKENIIDLGDITNARGTEAVLPIWVRTYAATQNGAFNFKIVK
jgi:8-hydroxy-5-deazaflavin:NADPH oxidoreductase